MRKIGFLTFIALAFSLCMQAQNHSDAVVFELKDGSKVTYMLEELPKMAFSGTDIVVTTAGGFEARHEQKAVLRYVFVDTKDTAVGSATLKDGFRHIGNCVTIGNLKAGTAVNVYSTDGKMLMSERAGDNGSATISLERMPAGVYVVSYQNSSVKITKR